MDEKGKDEKAYIWTDFLIIAVLFKCALQNAQSTLLGSLMVLVFICFLKLM